VTVVVNLQLTSLPCRSRATSPSASAPSDSAAAAGYTDEGYARLTARQRARMEKEAGIAEDVAWHEMELLPNLTYTWKGKGVRTCRRHLAKHGCCAASQLLLVCEVVRLASLQRPFHTGV
jgi:hypothetical protein